jgi:hypothetical protein
MRSPRAGSGDRFEQPGRALAAAAVPDAAKLIQLGGPKLIHPC